jgi:hypothetical protein
LRTVVVVVVVVVLREDVCACGEIKIKLEEEIAVPKKNRVH